MRNIPILAFCAITSASSAQEPPEIHILDWHCLEGQTVEPMCLTPNQAVIIYEAIWNDGQPKTIAATADGQLESKTYREIPSPGIDSMTVTYHPPWHSNFNLWSIYLELFDNGICVANSGDDALTFAVTYPPPDTLTILGVEQMVADDGSTILSAHIHASDWNLYPNMFHTCGEAYTAVRTELVSCEDQSVLQSQMMMQSEATSNTYEFSFSWDGPATYVMVKTSIVHVEKGLDTMNSLLNTDSLVGIVKTAVSECELVESLNTVVATEPATSSIMEAYPNPCRDWCKIGKANTVGTVMVTDASGRTVLSGELRPDGIINTESWSPGIYLVTVRSNDNIYTQRVVRE